MITSVILAFVCIVGVALDVKASKALLSASCLPEETTGTALPTYGEIHIRCPNGSVLQQTGALGSQRGRVLPASEPDAEAQPIDKLVAGATYRRITRNSGKDLADVLSIPQLPPDKCSAFFHCKAKKSERSCFIRVDVPAAPRLGPNVCAVTGTSIKFRIEAPGETVKFMCGDSFERPIDPSKAYDENCQQRVNLTDVVPDATYTPAPLPSGMNEVRIPNLSLKHQTLCYICFPRGRGGKGTGCAVLINIKAAAPDPPERGPVNEPRPPKPGDPLRPPNADPDGSEPQPIGPGPQPIGPGPQPIGPKPQPIGPDPKPSGPGNPVPPDDATPRKPSAAVGIMTQTVSTLGVFFIAAALPYFP